MHVKNYLEQTTHTQTAWLQYLGAAIAAYKAKAYEYCDAYLNKALAMNPDSKVAVALVRAQIQFELQPERAMLTLQYCSSKLQNILTFYDCLRRLMKNLRIGKG